MMWAISTGICPIGSLLLLIFAPPSPGTNPQWFGFFVGTIGIAFGLCSAMLIGRSVAQPVGQLRAAGKQVTTYEPDNGPHGFYFGRPELPESKEAAKRAVAFFKEQFAK
jgi:hypothetical protein